VASAEVVAAAVVVCDTEGVPVAVESSLPQATSIVPAATARAPMDRVRVREVRTVVDFRIFNPVLEHVSRSIRVAEFGGRFMQGRYRESLRIL
jgi:hypothetical protein